MNQKEERYFTPLHFFPIHISVTHSFPDAGIILFLIFPNRCKICFNQEICRTVETVFHHL
jgi:hypothetical protein